MANLIITVIAIALVAIASLMGAYYGGSAFLNNQSAANASTVLNQAQQIAGAWNAYLADNLNTAPATLTALVTNNYLAQVPTAPAEAGGVNSTAMSVAPNAAGTHYFAYADLGVPGGNDTIAAPGNFSACFRVLKTSLGPSAAEALSGVPSAAYGAIYNTASIGNGTFGCAKSTGAAPTALGGSGTIPPAGHYVMEYLLQ